MNTSALFLSMLGPLSLKRGACLFSLSKLPVISQKTAWNFTQSVKHRFVLIMNRGSPAWCMKTPSSRTYEAWTPVQSDRVTHLLSAQFSHWSNRAMRSLKDLFGFHILGVSKCPSVIVNSKCQGLHLIYLCVFRPFSKLVPIRCWVDGWVEGWKTESLDEWKRKKRRKEGR